MAKVCVRSFSLSLDGYGAGIEQSLANPLGVRGMELHEWAFQTRTFKAMFGQPGGESGIDDDYAQRGFDNIGAWVLGRNMFGPVRGPWPDEEWKGWWGDIPPYHCPVYVLTHHPRAPLVLSDTTFHFVTDGIESALRQAQAAARGKDVRIGGGVATIRAYLQAQRLDELHLAVTPVLLGRGENLYAGLDLPALGYATTKHEASARVTHVTITRPR
ncbi:MAG: dihydrofolate reductase family protein [Solimonas sp.]